jgi:hypothetical protein
MPPKRILLLEDDPLQAEWFVGIIAADFPDAEVLYFDSEFSFMKALHDDEIQSWKPQYALLDLLIRFYSLEDISQLDPGGKIGDVPEADEAGIRCRAKLVSECPSVKTVIMTVMDFESADFPVIQKGSDEFVKSVVEFLQK